MIVIILHLLQNKTKKRHALRHLIPRSPLQAVRVELVHIQHVDGTFNAEVMQLASHFKNQQVVLKKMKPHQYDASSEIKTQAARYRH